MKERKGLVTWMLIISGLLIISLVFNCKYYFGPPPAKPTVEIK